MFRLAVHQKFTHYKPAQHSPQPQHRATTQATTQAADSSADTGDGYTDNYTWDDGTYSGGDTGYYGNNSYNNYDNGPMTTAMRTAPTRVSNFSAEFSV